MPSSCLTPPGGSAPPTRPPDSSRSVSIKGAPSGDAVLVTAAATYDLKTVDTTNALLLLPDGAPAASAAVAAASAGAHVELVRAAPRFDALDAILDATAYGDAHHGGDGSTGSSPAGLPPPLPYPSLLAAVQASDAELRSELAARRAWAAPCGGVRVLAGGYGAALAEAAVAVAVASAWPLDAAPGPLLLSALVADGYDAGVAAAGIAAAAGEELDACALPAPPPPPPSLFAFDPRRLRVHALRKLLNARDAWDEGELADAWADALPPGVAPDPAALAGEAVAAAAPAPRPAPGAPAPPPGARTVTKLRAADLPRAPGARFGALFAARPRWTRAELAPYLHRLATPPGTTVEALLVTHARASSGAVGGETLYSAR